MKLRTLTTAIFFVAIFALAVTAGNDVRWMAKLSGVGKGKAAYKVNFDNRATNSELQIECENLARNANYTVIIDDQYVWQSRTNGFGTFEIRERWTGSPIKVAAGTPVVVIDEASGRKVLSGTFFQN